VLADLEPHLRYYWHKLDPEMQYTLAALPLLEQPMPPSTLERLAAAGLVNEGRYLDSALETFVRQQQVEGLLQGGPFLLDTRRGLVAAQSQAVHLTPTEFAALKLFLDRPGQLVTAEEIEAALWPGEFVPDPERARGVIKKLRAALGKAGEAMTNRRGQGWLLSLDIKDYG
jgi:DNA-binding response OmpR family regulator